MTKEELAKEIANQLLCVAPDQIFFRVVMPDNIGSTAVNINLHRTEPGVTAAIRDAIQSAIVEGIDRYIRATVPEGPGDIQNFDFVNYYRSMPPISVSDSTPFIQYIDHLERTITMLMDEGNVYQQGRDAAKREWEDERKELVELLGLFEWNNEGFCVSCTAIAWDKAPDNLHDKDCRLAKAIGAERKQ